jgi:hypothetical protein
LIVLPKRWRSLKIANTLFKSIDDGFCLIEMIYDRRENPIDWRYL